VFYKAIEEVMGACSQLSEVIRAEESHMVTLIRWPWVTRNLVA
jgi:hypothetical protein